MFSTIARARILMFFNVALAYQAQCVDSSVYRKLLIDLTTDKNNVHFRPVNDTSEAVSVGFRFTPTISILDDANQKLLVRGMLLLKWYDYRLAWEPNDYGDISEVDIPLFDGDKQQVWTPEVVLNESLVTDYQSFRPETKTATVYYNGTIYWYTLATTTSFCRIDVQCYPFDVQTCHLTFTTWLHQSNEQTFYTIDDLLTKDTYKKYRVEDGQWDATVTYHNVGSSSYDCITCQGQLQSYVCYTLEFKRGHIGWYLMSILLPCLVIVVMSISVPWLPLVESVDPASFGLTCILTLFVFISFLFSTLPATGEPMVGYLIVLFISIAFTTTAYTVVTAWMTPQASNTNPNNVTPSGNVSTPANPMQQPPSSSPAPQASNTNPTNVTPSGNASIPANPMQQPPSSSPTPPTSSVSSDQRVAPPCADDADDDLPGPSSKC